MNQHPDCCQSESRIRQCCFCVFSCLCGQVHIGRHGSACGTVSGPEPVKQLAQSEDPELRRASWRSSHSRDTQQCHRPHRHQPVSAQDGAAPPHTHVP